MSFKIKMVGPLLAVLAFVVVPNCRAGAINTKQSVDELVAEQQKIRKDVTAEARGWDAIPKSKRSELLTKQDEMFALLTGKQTLSDLNEIERIEVADSVEWIKALADNAEEERQVCRRERKTGSNRVETVCRTVADMNRDRERSKNGLRQDSQLNRTPPSTGAQF